MKPVDYDEVAHAYDRRYKANDYGGVVRAIRSFCDGAGNALEVGCGTGHWLSIATDAGLAVAGLDASAEMLGRARERLPAADLRRGRAEKLPWSEGSFARVLCINALHHFDDGAAFVAEARRVLSADGGLMVVGLDPHEGRDRWWIYECFEGALERDRERYPAAANIRKWMTEADFTRTQTVEAQHIELRFEIRKGIAEGRFDKDTTSQLLVLDDDAYRAGMAKLLVRAQLAESRGEVGLADVDLRLWCTIGWT